MFLVFAFSQVAFAYSYYVNGYYRSNGTYVRGHYKTSPDQYKYNNYSYKSYQPRYNNSYYRNSGIRVPGADRVVTQFQNDTQRRLREMNNIGNRYSESTRRIQEQNDRRIKMYMDMYNK